MHTDRYTKFILTVIAIGLIANLFAPFLKPTPAIAQGTGKKWSDVQYANVDAGGQTKLLQQGYEPFAAGPSWVYFRK
jgi:hypothetical protein